MGDADVAPVSPDDDGPLRENRELVDGPLGADLLEDANEEVGEHHDGVGEVSPGPRDRYEARQHEVYAVEEREGVLGDDLAHGLGGRPGIGVREAVGKALGHLL